MRTLPTVKPTPEQLSILSQIAPGILVIRGAAGSGKTTTAILRLRSLLGSFINRRKRLGVGDPVRALVLSYNRTLRGYIEELVRQQVASAPEVELQVSTFGKWGFELLGSPAMVDASDRVKKIRELGAGIPLDPRFLDEEVDYLLGRFQPQNLGDYLQARRTGRGATPRVDEAVRQAILSNVVEPYAEWKRAAAVLDWNDIAVELSRTKRGGLYEVIVADEVQDFSANQVRAIANHTASDYSLTFIVDSAQRIYARGFPWTEVDIVVRPENSRRLERNYRNTIEIARFAASLLAGIPLDDDGTMPDFTRSTHHGPLPVVIKGRFRDQVQWAIDYIHKNARLEEESVAFLHPLGWFGYTREALNAAGLPYVEITRETDWPTGSVNIALSTLASAKGLEFDHVFVLGLSKETLPHEDEDDDRKTKLRRLIAMGVGRARKSVCLGYHPDNPPSILDHLGNDTFELIEP